MAETNYERTKDWRKNNRDKVNAQAKRYRDKHRAKIYEAVKAWRKKNPEKRSAQRKRYRQKYRDRNSRAIRARREEKLAKIAGRPRPKICDLCHKGNRRIHFDHCHARGHFRGWLCSQCNKTLGLVYDDPRLLRRMAKYLEKHHGKTDVKTAKCSAQQSFCWTKQELPGPE